MWAYWVAAGLVAWLVVGLAVALAFGAMVRLADRRQSSEHAPASAAAALGTQSQAQPQGQSQGQPLTQPRPVAARRRFPLPPIGGGLVGVATALMVAGYAVRLSGASGPSARLLSMDAPLSVPRLFVAGAFAVAAVAAFAGAGQIPGRRTWWTAVGLVSTGIAAVKAGGSLHAEALSAAAELLSPAGAVAVSLVLAAAVIGGLWWLSRGERRDRRRVLSSLALYGLAAVGLSAISSSVAGFYGGASSVAAAVTFVEETGEAVSGVVFLLAVLVGVAPRLVLPADWVLQRAADAHTLELAPVPVVREAVPDGWAR